MEKRIVYTRPDGGITILVPVYNDPIGGFKPDEETENEYITRVARKSITPGATNIHILDDSEIMPDRTFRNAWVQGANKVPEVDMVKARILHMDKIRVSRNEKLLQLDKDWMKAMGQDGDASSVEDERQSLRDLPASFDLTIFTTPEELKAAWPASLNREPI